jgi:hypothetical protein
MMVSQGQKLSEPRRTYNRIASTQIAHYFRTTQKLMKSERPSKAIEIEGIILE